MSKRQKNLHLMWLCAAVASSAWAEQTISVGEIAQLGATISMHEPNILAVQGRKITELKGWSDELQLQLDQVNGRATFFLANPKENMRAVTLQASDDLGGTYVFHLTPKDIPGEVILLKPREAATNKQRIGTHSSYQRAIKNMMLALNKSEHPDARQVNQEIALWQSTRLFLHRTIQDNFMKGEHYLLTNLSQANLTLAEQEFYKKGVMAVAIEKHTLQPGESTAIYVVKADQNNE